MGRRETSEGRQHHVELKSARPTWDEGDDRKFIVDVIATTFKPMAALDAA
ncbi:MAG TPA: hypothetical protein VIN77_13170 [Aurantimonas sp.]